MRRLPHGGRGLKFPQLLQQYSASTGRLPHGGRGLKSLPYGTMELSMESSPARGTWVEIPR